MNISNIFPKEQFETLNYLHSSEREVSISELTQKLNIDQVYVSATIKVLSDFGLINSRKITYNEFSLGKKGEEFLKNGFPEITIIKTLVNNIGQSVSRISIQELPLKTGLDKKTIGESLKYLERKKLGQISRGEVELSSNARELINVGFDDESLINYFKEKKSADEDEIKKSGINLQNGLSLLSGRSQVINVKERNKTFAVLTDEGKKLLKNGIKLKVEVTNLTSDLLKDNKWKDVVFKPYNVADETIKSFPGKMHPFVKIFNETRSAFFDMGFSEIKSSHVESSFWDFDALFQPQDHPAREMQDTFYLNHPRIIDLPDSKLVEEVARTHESGGSTGSTGWNYKWSYENAKKAILRTHTTVASARALYKNPKPPIKAFTIDPVYRRENVTFKHLPVFYQVDGIIADENANFATLIGTLTEFLKKMGFSKFEFRPSFFPYTEPSTEVYAWSDKKNMWIEIAGAGIFREEVTKPLGCNVPVLAWGFGFERLVMLRYNIMDIRDIYYSSIKWLKEVVTCL